MFTSKQTADEQESHSYTAAVGEIQSNHLGEFK